MFLLRKICNAEISRFEFVMPFHNSYFLALSGFCLILLGPAKNKLNI